MRFDEYHRTVIGYHGTRLSVALDIVNRRRGFKFSRNPDDWLGHGVYFWEHAPQQAYRWAEQQQKRQKWDEPVAILASMIRLGYCFDLLDPYNVRYLKGIYEEYRAAEAASGRSPTHNAQHKRYLDCEVFQYAYALIDNSEERLKVDSARGVYVPVDEKHRIWKGSWIYEGAHIQICVRNPDCVLGTWLYSPTNVENGDAARSTETAEVVFKPEDQGSGQEAEGDVDGGSHPIDGQGRTDDPG